MGIIEQSWTVFACPDCGQIGTHADTCTCFPGDPVVHGNRVEVAPASQLAGAFNALKDIAAIGVGTTSAREDALEMQRLARNALASPSQDDKEALKAAIIAAVRSDPGGAAAHIATLEQERDRLQDQLAGAVEAVEAAFAALTDRDLEPGAARARAGVVLQDFLNSQRGSSYD